tara:strand:+ start:620 stop:1114 length:495 start_codon:yes stop_codon:yes gene_type:complete
MSIFNLADDEWCDVSDSERREELKNSEGEKGTCVRENSLLYTHIDMGLIVLDGQKGLTHLALLGLICLKHETNKTFFHAVVTFVHKGELWVADESNGLSIKVRFLKYIAIKRLGFSIHTFKIPVHKWKEGEKTRFRINVDAEMIKRKKEEMELGEKIVYNPKKR